jgi:hypothetical protein
MSIGEATLEQGISTRREGKSRNVGKYITSSWRREFDLPPSLVHPDQAGFMIGRKIEDQVKLAKFRLNYAEVAEEDGVIIAFDQEKA